MSCAYHVARAHQEELLRDAQRGRTEDDALASQEKSLLGSARLLNLRLAYNLLRKGAGDAPTTA